MKAFIKRTLNVFLALVMVVHLLPAAAGASNQILLNEVFDDYATNALPGKLTIMGGQVKVVETGALNKALLIKKNSTETTVRANIGNLPEKYIFSVDMRYSGKPLSMSIGMNSSATATSQDNNFITITNGRIFTHDNKVVGYLSEGKNYTLTFRISSGQIVDMLINDSEVLYRWKLAKKIESGAVSIKKSVSEENELYVDNMRLYEGHELLDNFPEKEYNHSIDDSLNPGNTFGDYTFFNNHFCYTGPNKTSYPNFTAVPKTNEIVCHRLIDYTNPNREDYIYLNQTDTSNDCYFDINCRISDYTTAANRKYSYYIIEGDFKKDILGSTDQMFLLRDTASGNSQINVVPATVQPDGSLKFTNGKTVSGVVKKGVWYNYKMAVNLEKSVVDVYVNDELAGADIPINTSLKQINMLRCSLTANGQKSDLYVDNFSVTGLVKPYSHTEFYHTDVMSDESVEREFLEDKIAMHGYGKQMYVNGEKSKITPEPVYDKENGELYVSAETLIKAFSLGEKNIAADKSGTVTFDSKTLILDGGIRQNGEELLIPVKEFAQKILGKYVFSMENGIILFADREINLDASGWDYLPFRDSASNTITPLNGIDHLNSFLTFERPSAQQLLEDFKNTTGDYNVHPRVLLTKDEFAVLREKYKTDEAYKKVADVMITLANQKLSQPVCTYKFDDSFRTLTTAEELLARFRYWGFAYQITGDSKYAERAFAEFEAAAKFPDFNTSHIIDTGEYCAAFALGYDWMYAGFTPGQRTFIQEFVMEKALRPLASGVYGGITSTSGGNAGWRAFKWSSNYNALINGGVITAAAAFMEADPEYCANVISDSLKSAEYAFLLLTPGGGWIEAFTYWNFCMQYMIYEMAACDSAFGSSYGLENCQGVADTVDYAIASIGSNGINNYHDSGRNIPNEDMYSYDTFSYLAKKFNNKAASAMRAYTRNKIGGTGLFDALYYDFEIGDSYESVLSSLNTVQKIDGVEMFSVRDTYDKENAGLYFSTHFGPTSCYHSQNDTGTFVLDLMGERWADDLGADDYLLQNELGYKQSDLYRYRAEGHNTLVVNNGTEHNQTNGLFFDIDKYEYNENSAYMTADLPYLYKDVPELKMGYFIGDNKTSVTMRSELTANKDSEIYWFMHTKADIFIDGNSAYLSQNGKNVKIDFLCNGNNAVLGEMAAQPLSTSPKADEQHQNEEFKKIYIRFNAKANTPTNLTVKISSVGKPSNPISDTSIAQWKLEEKLTETSDFVDTTFKMYYMGSEIDGALPVYDGEFPQIDVVPTSPDTIVEISQARNVDEKTLVKVWDKDKKSFSIGIVEYFTASGLNMNLFESIVPQSVEVSSTPEAANVKDNMLDGSYSTRWTCMAKGEYAIFDLGSEQSLDGVGLAFWKGAERNYYFKIEVSTDGVNYTPVLTDVTSYGDSTIIQPYVFENAVNARYIRYTGYGNSVTSASNVNSNVLEFRALRNKFGR